MAKLLFLPILEMKTFCHITVDEVHLVFFSYFCLLTFDCSVFLSKPYCSHFIVKGIADIPCLHSILMLTFTGILNCFVS